MIAFLKGTLVGKTLQKAYIDVNGIGFEVNMSSTSLGELPDVGMDAQVLTYLQVRDDGMTLYGFTSEDERDLFERLIGVSGVGPKVALAALSYYSANDLIAALAAQDVASVSKIPGIGKKTASRLILELKDAFDLGVREQPVQAGTHADASLSTVQDGVRDALLAMGFTSTEADLALKGAEEGLSESALLSYALKRLGSL